MLQTRDDFSAFRKGYILKNREIQSVVTVLMVCCWVVMDFYLCIYLLVGSRSMSMIAVWLQSICIGSNGKVATSRGWR